MVLVSHEAVLSNESEAVAVACSLSYVRKRSAGDIVSFVADLNVLQGQDTLLLSDSLVLSRNALSRRALYLSSSCGRG